MKELRGYQSEARTKLYSAWSTGTRKVLVVAFTGWGKTIFTATVAKENLASHYIIFAVRKRTLVDNLSDELDELGINHSVYMAGSKRFNPFDRVQVCSIDTLRSRSNYPHVDKKNVIIIADEAHESKSKSYQDFFNAYPESFLLGVTATPYNFLSHFDTYIETIRPSELRDQGHLLPFRIYAPLTMDIGKVRVSRQTGEYVQEDLAKVVGGKKIYGDIISHWNKLAENRPTLLFASSVKESRRIAFEFESSGIPAIHIDSDCSDEDRNEAERGLNNGKYKIVTNVGLWTTGKNIPKIGCVVDASPTKKVNLFIQKNGRGVRVNGTDRDCILIDHTTNVHDHGDPYADREVVLESPEKSTTSAPDIIIEKLQTCRECLRAFTPGPTKCPYCNNAREIKVPRISVVDQELTYLTPDDFAALEVAKRKRASSQRAKKFWNQVRSSRFLHRKFSWSEEQFYNHLIKKTSWGQVTSLMKREEIPHAVIVKNEGPSQIREMMK
jgi:superfamily II DNA or RNA helicase